jgi:type IV pili sensor histidine kinase/response regulator
MQIKPFAVTLYMCVITACSSPPSLSEPKGDFVPANPEQPSYIKKVVPVVSKPSSTVVKGSNMVSPRGTLKPQSKNDVKYGLNSASDKKITPNLLPKATNPQVSTVKDIKVLKGFVTPKVSEPIVVAKNPFNRNPLPNASVIVPPIIKIAPPPRNWVLSPGSSLKDKFTQLATGEKCDFSRNWSVRWNTQTDYPIDSPLTFNGSFEEVTTKLFMLYKNAQTPLYADGYKSQCIVIVSDAKK